MDKELITTMELHEATGIGINRCKKILAEVKKEMLEKGMVVAYERKLMVPTKLVKRKLGL